MDIRDLYQEIILEHSKRPRNHGPCPGETAHAHAENPSCGDEVTVHAKIVLTPDKKVEAITFTGQGCALSQASASLMTTKLRGKTVDEAIATVKTFHAMMTNGAVTETELEKLGDAQVLQGAAQFPQRVKCVTLAWHAVDQIFENGDAAQRAS